MRYNFPINHSSYVAGVREQLYSITYYHKESGLSLKKKDAVESVVAELEKDASGDLTVEKIIKRKEAEGQKTNRLGRVIKAKAVYDDVDAEITSYMKRYFRDTPSQPVAQPREPPRLPPPGTLEVSLPEFQRWLLNRKRQWRSQMAAPLVVEDIYDDRERAYTEALEREGIKKNKLHDYIAISMQSFREEDGWKVTVKFGADRSKITGGSRRFLFAHSSFSTDESLPPRILREGGVGMVKALEIRARLKPHRYSPPSKEFLTRLPNLGRWKQPKRESVCPVEPEKDEDDEDDEDENVDDDEDLPRTRAGTKLPEPPRLPEPPTPQQSSEVIGYIDDFGQRLAEMTNASSSVSAPAASPSLPPPGTLLVSAREFQAWLAHKKKLWRAKREDEKNAKGVPMIPRQTMIVEPAPISQTELERAAPVVPEDIYNDRERAYMEALERNGIQRGNSHGRIVISMAAFPFEDGWKCRASYTKSQLYRTFNFQHSSFSADKSSSNYRRGAGIFEALKIRSQLFPRRYSPPSSDFNNQIMSLSHKYNKTKVITPPQPTAPPKPSIPIVIATASPCSLGLEIAPPPPPLLSHPLNRNPQSQSSSAPLRRALCRLAMYPHWIWQARPRSSRSSFRRSSRSHS